MTAVDQRSIHHGFTTTNPRYPIFDPALDIPGPWERVRRESETGPSRKGKLGNCDEKCLTWTKYWAVRDLLNSHYVVLRSVPIVRYCSPVYWTIWTIVLDI